MTIASFGNFSLYYNTVHKTQVKHVEQAVNHIIVIDVSGSMYGSLPTLRTQLKNKLVDLVRDGDTVSMIWFSGKNQYGTLLEDVEIRSLKDLSSVQKSIDRFLVPQGLTGFKQPLEEVSEIISRIGKSRNGAFSMFFMTDGYDNQWSQAEILKATKALEDKLVNAAIVEYGWNCNRPLLTKMAETVGGNYIFSEDLQSYQVTFEKELSKRSTSKKIEVSLSNEPMWGLVYALDNEGSLLTFSATNRKVHVPESLAEVWFFVEADHGPKEIPANKLDAVYAGLTVLSQRMMANEIFGVLAKLGDVRLIKKFVNCFSKQDYSSFEDMALGAARWTEQRFKDGRDFGLVPAEDAYTVLDVLDELASDDSNLLYPFHEEFVYEKIGASRVDAAEVVSDKDLKVLTEQLAQAKTPKDLAELTEKIAALTASKVKLNFVHKDKSAGFPVSSLTWNESRPNVSILFTFPGTIKLPVSVLPKAPDVIETKIYRNYTIIRDGIVHTRVLPVSLTRDSFKVFQANGLLQGESYKAGKIYLLDLSDTPVINRQMVKTVSAKDLFAKEWEMLTFQAYQKVLNTEYKSKFERASEGYEFLYGPEVTAWLKDLGITERGFSPKTVAGDFEGDVYMAKFLETKIKGLSSLPSVNDVLKRLKDGKPLLLGQSMLKPGMDELEEFKNSSVYQKAKDQNGLLKQWLESERKDLTTEIRKMRVEIAKLKFAVIVGHVWFNDFKSLDDNQMLLDMPGAAEKIQFTALLEEKEIGGD